MNNASGMRSAYLNAATWKNAWKPWRSALIRDKNYYLKYSHKWSKNNSHHLHPPITWHRIHRCNSKTYQVLRSSRLIIRLDYLIAQLFWTWCRIIPKIAHLHLLSIQLIIKMKKIIKLIASIIILLIPHLITTYLKLTISQRKKHVWKSKKYLKKFEVDPKNLSSKIKSDFNKNLKITTPKNYLPLPNQTIANPLIQILKKINNWKVNWKVLNQNIWILMRLKKMMRAIRIQTAKSTIKSKIN